MKKRRVSREESKKCDYCQTECNYVMVIHQGKVTLYHLWECPYCETTWIIAEGEEIFGHCLVGELNV